MAAPGCDKVPVAEWTKGARFHASHSSPKSVSDKVSPFPHCRPCCPPQRFGGQGERAQPCTGTASPAGTGQGAVALSEAAAVLMLQKCTGLPVASPATPQLFHPEARPSLGKQGVSAISPASSTALCPAPDDNLFYDLPASLPRLSAFSPFTRCFLRRCIFSYNIMSDPDFPKSTLSRLDASLVSPRLGWTRIRAPPLPSGGPLCPPPTPHSGCHNAHFHIKSHPLYLGHKPFPKVDKIYSISNKINRMCSTLQNSSICPCTLIEHRILRTSTCQPSK